MKTYPRSSWTAHVPKSTTVGDTYIGMDYFDTPPTKIEFIPVGNNRTYMNLNPFIELDLLRKKASNGTAWSDIDYNYAISQNFEGIFVLRGGITKCRETQSLRVLMLIGQHEAASDLLKQNQTLLVDNPAPRAVLKLGDVGVHVFDLIEYLSGLGFYQARNDGIYSEQVVQAVKKLQQYQGQANLSGVYDTGTYSRCLKKNHQLV
ncbi:MAG: peptidoglycan-binding protein [Solirubrobacterales bacterium]|nr:peptidoglycan-binding protein [Solirubrobacterales bacterium]